MRLHRFYIHKPLGEELVVENAGEKEIIHQWLSVFRYTSGDEVFLFSSFNPGVDFLYRITATSKQSVELVPVSSQANILPLPLTLVMALVKKDTFETIVRQATELGVTRIIPVAASRSEKKNLNFERLSAIATEATEQSGRGGVPHIEEIMTLTEALSHTKECINIVGSLTGDSFDTRTKDSPLREYALWVGPEGGWTEEEESFFRDHACLLVKSVPTTLKAETAAIHLLSLLSYSS
jgi:16S rRNA (uracil1498-N3)-methyltransferase